MDCAAVRELAVAYLDGEAVPEQARALEEHAAVCPHCAQILEEHRELDRLLGRVLNSHVGARPSSTEEAHPLARRVRVEARRLRFHARARAIAAVFLAALLGFAFWASVSRERLPPEAEKIILSNLDVLEAIEEEAGTDLLESLAASNGEEDIVEILIDEVASREPLDLDVFDYLLEEELALEEERG